MQPNQPNQRSHLFTLRLWTEEGAEGQSEWRGRLYDAQTGHVRYFRDWASLIPLLLAMVRDTEQNRSTRPSSPTEP